VGPGEVGSQIQAGGYHVLLTVTTLIRQNRGRRPNPVTVTFRVRFRVRNRVRVSVRVRFGVRDRVRNRVRSSPTVLPDGSPVWTTA